MKRDLEKILTQETIFKGKYLQLNRLTLENNDGKTAEREVVCVRNATAILPIDKDANVHLIRQHRAAIGQTILEVPAGLVDENESLEQCATRECEEETGWYPNKVEKLITYAHAEGYSTGFITLFVGFDLKHTGKMNLDETECVEQVSMPLKELIKMVEKNEIVDSKTILCALLSRKAVRSRNQVE